VGSGKTTLFLAALGQAPATKGKVGDLHLRVGLHLQSKLVPGRETLVARRV
jgi:ABC-type Mn2+/Zn2+ transport system ATPase subunit